LCEQRKWAKKIAPLSQTTTSLMKLLGRSGYRTSLSCILTGGFPAATLRAQPALFQCSIVAPAWGFSTKQGRTELLFSSLKFEARVGYPHVLVRGGKAFWKNKSKSATWTPRPVLLSQEGESKPDEAKRSDRHMHAPARGKFLCLLSCRYKKVGRQRHEVPGETIHSSPGKEFV
jgi:hypothetical protein